MCDSSVIMTYQPTGPNLYPYSCSPHYIPSPLLYLSQPNPLMANWTPLHYCIMKDNVAMAELLVTTCADRVLVETKDSSGRR